MKTYILKVTLQQEEDKRWSSWVDDLPGCAAWGYTREEALKAVQHAAEAYIEDMIDAGEEIPEGIEVVNALAVTVTIP